MRDLTRLSIAANAYLAARHSLPDMSVEVIDLSGKDWLFAIKVTAPGLSHDELLAEFDRYTCDYSDDPDLKGRGNDILYVGDDRLLIGDGDDSLAVWVEDGSVFIWLRDLIDDEDDGSHYTFCEES